MHVIPSHSESSPSVASPPVVRKLAVVHRQPVAPLDGRSFASMVDAQAELDGWVTHYNQGSEAMLHAMGHVRRDHSSHR